MRRAGGGRDGFVTSHYGLPIGILGEIVIGGLVGLVVAVVMKGREKLQVEKCAGQFPGPRDIS